MIKNMTALVCAFARYYHNKYSSIKIYKDTYAKKSGKEMKSKYSYKEILDIAEKSNMLIYEHLNYKDINNNYFYDYNTINPDNKIFAPIGVNYVLLVKK